MPAIDVNTRVEPETIPMLERLAHWDTANIETIRSTYFVVRPAPVPPDPRVTRSDETIPGIDGRPDVRVRWYRPVDADGPLPGIVYLHGGAYIMGSVEENDDRLDRMVIELGCAIVSVDWRLAPEHPYPEGLDDADTVWHSVVADPARYGVDPQRLVLIGSSAGAGLAAALCIRLRDNGGIQPKLQLLIYPMLEDREIWPSITAITDPGHWGLWQLRAERLSWQAYLGDLHGVDDIPATAVPGRATDLSGVAPAFLGIGDADAYLDANLAYASRLSSSGVPVELHVYPGVIHGGYLARPQTPRTRQFLLDSLQALRLAFGLPVDRLS